MYRYYITPSSETRSVTLSESTSRRYERTYFWFVHCLAALSVGFSLVSLFTVAILLPASLFRLQKTFTHVTVHANDFKLHTNALWTELSRARRSWRPRRDKLHNNATLHTGPIRMPWRGADPRRRPQPADRFLPNDSLLGADDEHLLPDEGLRAPSRTTLSRPMVRITIRPHVRPLIPVPLGQLVGDEAQRAFRQAYAWGDDVPLPTAAPTYSPAAAAYLLYTAAPDYAAAYATAQPECVGAPGPPGEDGLPGGSGADGADGAPGADGTFGQKSEHGCQICPPGLPGFPGVMGAIGDQGRAGAPGAAGVPGSAGPTSYCQGTVGENGAPGQPGPRGEPGARGLDWLSGVGAPGLPGLVGVAGEPGPAGAAGRRTRVIGAPGATGAPGPAGTNGLPGTPGSAGPPGDPGTDRGYCPCPIRDHNGFPKKSNYGFGRS